MAARTYPGLVINDFSLEERIHRGSMSELWRVTHSGWELPLAMKIPSLGEGHDSAAIVGFEVEQMIMPVLTGPHVPRFVAAGDFEAQPYIVMEHIAGASLRARIEEAPLPPEEVALLGERVATALHDLHSQHVIHLDIKPSNVMFRATGEAVLIDYGLARHDRLPDLLAEEFHLPMGTGPYISPEQVRHIRSDSRSDIFSLGVVLYYLATGERPFGNPTGVHGLRRRLYRDPVPPRAIAPACPPWLQEIILHCLEIDPRARYDTAAQVAFQCKHPEQTMLTARGQRMSRDGFMAVAKRRLRTLGAEADPGQSCSGRLSNAPFILAALDLSSGSETLAEAIRSAAAQAMQIRNGSRLACLSVVKTSRIGMDDATDSEGHHLHVKGLVGLKDWARPLGLPPTTVTYHVLEAPDPAAAIIEFARSNHVDQIIMGARASSTLRQYLGSVSSAVVAQAPCTVTVVRAPAPAAGSKDQ